MEGNIVKFTGIQKIDGLISSNKVIETVREKHYKGQKAPASLYELCDYLDEGLNSKIFGKIMSTLEATPRSCSLLTAAADDDAEITVSTDENNRILGVDDLEIPKMRRGSMMFNPYLLEGANCLYHTARAGQEYAPHENMMVLPYLATLYAIKNSTELFDEKITNAALSAFIGDIYASLTTGIKDARSFLYSTLQKVCEETMESVRAVDYLHANRAKVHLIGMTKAIALFERCNQDGSHDKYLAKLCDRNLKMGKEINYEDPALTGEQLFNAYRNFVLQNQHCLRDENQPSEYEPPKFIFNREETCKY